MIPTPGRMLGSSALYRSAGIKVASAALGSPNNKVGDPSYQSAIRQRRAASKGVVEASRLLPEIDDARGQEDLSRRADLRRSIDFEPIADHRNRFAGPRQPGRSRPVEPSLPAMLRLAPPDPPRARALPADEFAILKAEELARLEEWRTSPGRLASNQPRPYARRPIRPDDVRFLAVDRGADRLGRRRPGSRSGSESLYEREVWPGLPASSSSSATSSPSEVMKALTQDLRWLETRSLRIRGSSDRHQPGIKPGHASRSRPPTAPTPSISPA